MAKKCHATIDTLSEALHQLAATPTPAVGWQDHAACRDHSLLRPDAWLAVDSDTPGEPGPAALAAADTARAVCTTGCPVRWDCLRATMAAEDDSSAGCRAGIIAGLHGADRHRLRRLQAEAKALPPAAGGPADPADAAAAQARAAALRSSGWSLADISRATGVSKSHIDRCSTAAARPSRATAAAILDIPNGTPPPPKSRTWDDIERAVTSGIRDALTPAQVSRYLGYRATDSLRYRLHSAGRGDLWESLAGPHRVSPPRPMAGARP